MPLDDRFPMYPGRVAGILYGRESSSVVLWMDDYSFDEASGGSATPDDIADFEQLLAAIETNVRPKNLAEVHDAILAAGWEDQGMLTYQVRSGLLLADAAALAAMSTEFWNTREALLSAAGGRHPEIGSPSWEEWVVTTARRAACVRSARILSLAALEALVNELLAAQHPDQYAEWEESRRVGFGPKLKNLLHLHNVQPEDLPWFDELTEHSNLRNTTIHHRPGWTHDERDQHSVAPDADMTQDRLMDTLRVVHDAVDGLFALYGTTTPDTHRPEWLRQFAGW